MKNNKLYCTLAFIVYLLPYMNPMQACTVVVAAKDNVALAGSNEDWSDPSTIFRIYAPSDSTLGWIKFGFAGGFPQAGLNEHGLFWDATSGPWRAMPMAEARKNKLDGPIMHKVIESCGSIADAREVFSQYYCDDMYMAMYLLGDSSGASLIADGDSLLEKVGWFQVLTNFHPGWPDIGGYPCSRYDDAINIFSQVEILDEYLIGSILDRTHQEGSYPTQYSLICNLKNAEVLIFYKHNFHEYLKIKLEEEFERSGNDYILSSIFSCVNLVSPSHACQLDDSVVTLRWEGKPGNTYKVFLSDNPEFLNAEQYIKTSLSSQNQQHFSLNLLTTIVWLLISLLINRSQAITGILTVSLCFFLIFTACQKEQHNNPEAETKQFSQVFSGLQQGKTYYWKVEASNPDGPDMKTNSLVYTFTRSY